MTKIPEEYQFASSEGNEELVRDLKNMYRQLASAINLKPDVITRFDSSGTGIDGQADDTNLAIGTINVNQSTDKVEVLTQHTSPSAVTWTTVS